MAIGIGALRFSAHLIGMFAIAIWDSRLDHLVLARDRFGEKPLYYMERPEAFLFGSEIKAILTWPGVPRVANFAALHDFLTFGVTLGPGDRVCRHPSLAARPLFGVPTRQAAAVSSDIGKYPRQATIRCGRVSTI